MKITMYIPNLIGCGAERVMVNLANYLCMSGFDVTILNYYENNTPYTLNSNIKRKYLFVGQKKQSFIKKCFQYFFPSLYSRVVSYNRLKKLKKYIKATRVDCYLVMLESTTIELLKLRKYINCPIIVSERNYPENYREDIKRKLYELAHFADGYVFQTEAAKEWYGKNVVDGIVIPNALNDEFDQLIDFRIDRKKVIISAGRLEKQKNHALLIKAFAEACVNDYTLEIYGEGPLKDALEKLAASLGVGDRVFLKGYSSNLKTVMAQSALFVLSSDYEGIPNVVLEAMAMGLPCITTDFAGGGAHVLIEDGEDGIIVPVANEHLMADAIRRVLCDRALAEKLSDNAMKKVKIFSAGRIYAEWGSYIKKICVKESQQDDNEC